ncbi:MAG: cytidine deaminase [Firmicutes bacterium]|nr:cytidine deaminase [Bacillota bacterium]
MKDKLASAAVKAREASYSPYSGFAVGAVLLAEDGRIFTGCNIENAAFSPTICAERVALFKAVSEGARGFKALAVSGGPAGKAPTSLCTPCGVCRQALSEFCRPDMPVICAYESEEDGSLVTKVFTLGRLLPESFGPDNL